MVQSDGDVGLVCLWRRDVRAQLSTSSLKNVLTPMVKMGQDGRHYTWPFFNDLDTVKPLMERHRHLNLKNFRRKNSVDGSFEEMVRGYRGSSTEGEEQ